MARHSVIIEGKENIRNAQILSWKSALKLECLGMKNSGRSEYAIVKEHFGWRGTKQDVYAKLVEYCDKEILNG